jgi:uncharacterized protein YkwD
MKFVPDRKKQIILCLALGSLLALFSCDKSTILPGPSFPTESEVEARSFDLINQDRAQQGLPALNLDSRVSDVARAHSADMRDRNFFSHKSPDGKTLAIRLKNVGITFRLAGENLARIQGVTDPAAKANTDFLSDDTHKTNLLNSQFKLVGIGVARSGNEYWITQDFIAP